MLISNKEFKLKYSEKEFNKFKDKISDYVKNPEKIKIKIDKEHAYTNNILNEPKPDEYQYYLTRYKALNSDERKLKNFFISTKQSREEVTKDYLPTVLDIEPISRCNFRCIMCQLSGWKDGQRAQDMNIDEYKELIDNQYGLTEIKLQGIGEPLLHPHFFEMVEYARKKNIWVRTTINGSLLENGKYKSLIDSGINDIQISFDGATQEVFERIRKKSDFNVVKKNVTDLNTYSNSLNKKVTNMWVLIQQFNKHQIVDFVKIAKEMKFKKMTFSIGIGSWGQDKWEKANNKKVAKEVLTQEIKKELLELKSLYNIDITLWDLQDKFSTKSVDKLCPWPFNRIFIGSDMRLSPCCMIANPDIVDLGDAKNLVKTWNSKLITNFRISHLSGNIPDCCKNCYQNDK